ncbi:probable cytochrome P450 6d5 [Aedes albopictus]|uniref:Cytochrome P450 n=1 Tax=Aedes albopictus TaxID=7160 RepID=A0ABM1ZAB8_AEDAL|nr:probable cytochrome P450 6d5 [Aedes albopictus]
MTPLSIGLALFCLGAFAFLQYIFGYWNRRGVPQLTPFFPFGNFSDLFLGKASFPKVCETLYERTKQWRLLGGYILLRPILLVNDPQLAKDIMVRDFQHFHDRGTHVDEANDPLSGHLFSLAGEKWKHLRAKLTPTFTSGRLKGMFQTLVDTGEVLQDYMLKCAKNEEVVEIRDVLARYNTDNIASVAFGIQIDSINNPNEPFRQIGRKFFESNFRNNMRIMITFMVPKLSKYLKIKSVDAEVEQFILGMARETLEYREKNGVVRKDMMQLLIQLRNTGTVSVDERWDVETTTKYKKLSIGEVAAQAHVFFLAGFETSSSTMSFCLYELAKNPEIQRKVQAEIDSVTALHEGKVTYDSINEMRYLECCIDETLRKYPPVPVLNRECTQEYKVPDSDITIEKGTAVILQISAMHHDPQYYPDPMRFDPDRFLDPEMKSKPYAPFGDGPRICIGLRMGKIQTKVGLSLMLMKFNFELSGHEEPELVMSPNTFLQTPVDGINLKVSCRK